MTATTMLISDPHKDAAPHGYVVQVNRSVCKCCGHMGESSQTFVKTLLRGNDRRLASRSRALNEAPKYNLPIEIIRAPVTMVPFCDKCPNPAVALTGLPYPPEEKNLTPASEAKPVPTVAAAPKKKATVSTDDLMEGLDL